VEKKFSEIGATRWLLWHLDFTKFNFGRGSAPVPAGGAYDAPPDPLVGWGGGHPLPIPHPFDTFGVMPTVPHQFSKPCAALGSTSHRKGYCTVSSKKGSEHNTAV